MSRPVVRFSVVIPLHNKRPYIARALQSVLAQMHAASDVIVVDDGSVDGGAEVVATEFPNVHLIRQINSGPGASRNRGVLEAHGDWVAFLDADDFWTPTHLAELASLISEFPSCALAATGFQEWSEGSPPPHLRPDGQRQQIDYFARAATEIGIVNSSTSAVRRDVFLRLGGFGPWRAGEDLELWARIALAHPVAISAAESAIYVRGTGGIMESLPSSLGRLASVADLSPSCSVVSQALAGEQHSCSPRSLEKYLDSRVIGAMREALVRGNSADVWRLRSLLRRPHVRATALPLVLSLLPRRVVASALTARSRIRRNRG